MEEGCDFIGGISVESGHSDRPRQGDIQSPSLHQSASLIVTIQVGKIPFRVSL